MARQVRRAKKVIYVFREGESEEEYAKRIRVAFSDVADKDNARRRVQQLVPGYEKGDPVTIGQIFPHWPEAVQRGNEVLVRLAADGRGFFFCSPPRRCGAAGLRR